MKRNRQSKPDTPRILAPKRKALKNPIIISIRREIGLACINTSPLDGRDRGSTKFLPLDILRNTLREHGKVAAAGVRSRVTASDVLNAGKRRGRRGQFTLCTYAFVWGGLMSDLCLEVIVTLLWLEEHVFFFAFSVRLMHFVM